MIDIAFNVETKEGLRSIRVLADKLDDKEWLADLLRRYDREWLRPRIDQHFETRQGWPARAKATEARIATQSAARELKSVSTLRRKLKFDVVRAKKRLGAVQEAPGFFKERERQDKLGLTGKRSRSMSEVLTSRANAVARRQAVLAEFERLAAGGDASKTTLTTRQTEKLSERIGRARQLDTREATLGKIASSFKTEIKDGKLVDASVIPWSGIHNEGGTAGHGAKIKARPFAYLEEVDVRVLVEMIRDSLGEDGGVYMTHEE